MPPDLANLREIIRQKKLLAWSLITTITEMTESEILAAGYSAKCNALQATIRRTNDEISKLIAAYDKTHPITKE